jgi:hypothetical protein
VIFLAQNQVLTGRSPLLEAFFQQNGFLVDVASLEFEVWKVPGSGNAVQVGSGRTAVNVGTTYPGAGGGRLGKGRYFATWTVPGNAQAAHEIRWFYKVASSDEEQVVAYPFEVLTCPVLAPRGLCSIAMMRAEGVAQNDASDYRCHQAIIQATAFIERVCRRWFYPAAKVFTMSSSGGPLLLLTAPIVGIEGTRVAYDGDFATAEALDVSSYRVYARHLSEGMVTESDDRNNPKLERVHNLDNTWRGSDWERWPVGERHIQIAGAFGYTDPDGASGGQTPALIRMACMKLAAKYALTKASGSASSSASSAPAVGPVKRLKTKDREVEFSEAAAATSSPTGMLSGDADVDGLLELYMGPPAMGVW